MHHSRRARFAAAITALVVALVGLGIPTSASAADGVRVVSGHVSIGDTSRSAVAGEVTVTAKRLSSYDAQITTVSTDADGNFSMTLAYSSYYPEYRFYFEYKGADPFYAAYWPGAGDSVTVRLAAGDRSDLDMVMPGPSTIRGHVTRMTDLPLRAGDVQVYYQKRHLDDTGYFPESGPVDVDADGNWQVGIAPGIYQFRFDSTSADFQDLGYYGAGPSYSVTVYGDRVLPDATLVPTNSISGTVQLGSATPRIAGSGEVVVSWKRSPTRNGPWPAEVGGSVETDEAGRYLITDLAPGWYSFSAHYKGRAGESYRDNPFYSFASGTELSAGSALRDNKIQLTRTYVVSGQVKVGTRAATAGEVELTAYKMGGLLGKVLTDAQGRYVLSGIEEDNATFNLYADYKGKSGYGRTWTTISPTSDRVQNFTLQRSTSLWGTVYDSAHQGLAGATVKLTSIWRSGEYAGEVSGTLTTETDASGSYSFTDINDDTAFLFYLTYEKDGYSFLSWPKNNEFMAPGTFKLASRELKANVNVTMFRSSSISGTIAGAGVASREFADGALGVQLLIKSGTDYVPSGYWEDVEADGSYELTDLAPGSYRVQAAYFGDRGEATVRSATQTLTEASTRTFSTTLRPFTRDISGDYAPDLVARSSDQLMLYPGTGAGKLTTSRSIASGWASTTTTAIAGDLDGDDNVDVIARDAAGQVTIHRGNGVGGWLGTIPVGVWPGVNKILAPGDVDGDGDTDLITRDSKGKIWSRLGDGAGGFADPVLIASGWSTYKVATASDFNRDGFPDVFALTSDGNLYLYPGDGTGGFKTRVKLKTGWKGYNAILGVGDFSGDWNPDLIARDSAGVLWLYKGNNSGAFSTKVKLSTGWKSRSLIS